ncbi:hypothetical protein [Leptospira barantonii]|uniref:PEGA domain-containing protein n=1 Tax=Leptospira barantonii TaxID=2023184 RepID=A0ABX4NTD2_9LEPT|nr:hypothetical protein [Leptospira barantonii]PJZ58278.1 hypothetical protein CH367_07825 [Leptospira barantonii]
MFNSYLTHVKTGSVFYKKTVILALIGIAFLFLGNVFVRIIATENLFVPLFLLGFLISVIALALLIVSAILRHGPITLYIVSILILLISLFPQMIDSNFYSVHYDENPVTVSDSLKIAGEIYTEGDVLVNGKSVERAGVKWSIDFPLALGENSIKVVLKRPSSYEKFSKEFKIERVTLEELAKRREKERLNKIAQEKKAAEDAKEAEIQKQVSIKEADKEALADSCDRNPEKAVKIENFNWIKDEYNLTYFNALVYNPCSIPLKDFKFHIEYFAPSGTSVDNGWETVYKKVDPGKRMWMKFSNSLWNSQASSVQLEISSVDKYK